MVMAVVLLLRPFEQLNTNAARESSANTLFIASSSLSKSWNTHTHRDERCHISELCGIRNLITVCVYLLSWCCTLRQRDTCVLQALVSLFVCAEDLLQSPAALKHLHLLFLLQSHLQPLLRTQHLLLQGALQLLHTPDTPLRTKHGSSRDPAVFMSRCTSISWAAALYREMCCSGHVGSRGQKIWPLHSSTSSSCRHTHRTAEYRLLSSARYERTTPTA